MISFDTTKADRLLIGKIVKRAMKAVADYGGNYDALSCDMDITACHANGCELDLKKLLNFPEFDFLHDILGIRRHLDRETGELMDFFLPRCAKPK